MVESGYPFYGQKVGILVFNGKSPRLPGDPGHAATFEYPVCYQIVNGSFFDLVEGSVDILESLNNGVRSLKKQGIKAIVGDCGLMALYQKQLAENSSLPIFSSALMLIPLIWNIIGQTGEIGVITGHSAYLKGEHLRQAGVDQAIPLKIQGMEEELHFAEVVIKGETDLKPDLMKQDILTAVDKLISQSDNIKAILLECSNLATFSKDVYDAFKLPVFDVLSGANLLEKAVNPVNF